MLPVDNVLRHTLVLDRGMLCQFSTGDVLQGQSVGNIGMAWPLSQFRAWQRDFPKELARLVIYGHGGLNSEGEVLPRAREMTAAFVDNHI